ncbi:aromatic prenyltransferase [Colletotrichum higginsianum]|uniref:Aromatic prenyltransferase n=2 Tax=Colletotrichum higginsianum TaxID=80884 RepID=H1VFN5_COLHI|nr:Aromatic prenyltransferase [Colletotrichum higginsianum IMI 349063]OBR05401.1 Aromatic prenyltransferase [Colletotrichum higginsianum IMI 349063]TIC93807.1 7-dimethylallyltryptophan synthase [Colletotrichum higginsianum]GJD00034.1 aromatic prenyltransferase [Colletotrichum higginsianum]CCF39038.1 aromatic prenyltransferase [Colletotrichum higginsianum]
MVAATNGSDLARQEDSRFWWDELAHPLLSLMKSAGYSAEEQEQYVEFVNQFVVPSLGPRPMTTKTGVRLPHFDSFCSDDFSPAELSWNVGPARSKIRVGSEPIGPFAGTSKDPFNQDESQVVMSRLLRQGRGPVDGELWEFFKKHLHVEAKNAHDIVAKMATNEHMTTNTISFDLEGELPAPKVYFYPIPISLLQNNHAGEIITDVIAQLPVNLEPSFNPVRDFVYRYKRQRDNEYILRLELIAFDAIRPADSRFKLYLRTKETCMARVEEVYSLGGALKGPEIDNGLDLIRSFYMHVLGTTAAEEDLPRSTHRTAGIIFNMELKHNSPEPLPKVYIPVRHYGGTDLRIAQSLSNFFRACGLTHMADTYVDAVQKAFPTQDFSTTIGRHSYVGLSYNKNGPYITMYYNTMTYSAGDERNADGKLVGPAAMKQRHLLD